ncbi:MAG: myo-inositol-1(or 4)-monophosphatase [Candidatus Paceibacteria bacterium]|jgi:myo-inositol-1(or 4)-monophosphatase
MDKATDNAAILEVAVAAAREAGEILMGALGNLAGTRIKSKSAARDLVTVADVASERLLVQRLRAAFPDHAIEAEEEVMDAPGDGPRWFLDPLDGTINFVHELPVFAVSMGLFVDGQPEVAVVHAPRLNETFTAIRGGGAFLNGEPIHVSTAATLGDSILATGFPYRRNELEHDNLANLGRFFYDVRGLRRLGSAAIDLAYVAAGRLDGYWELHLSPHDVAAGALLVREAGGLVTDADGGEEWLRGGHIVASGPGIHAAMRGRVLH